MNECLLEVPRFEYLLTDNGKDLSKKIFDMLLSDDVLDGMSMQLI